MKTYKNVRITKGTIWRDNVYVVEYQANGWHAVAQLRDYKVAVKVAEMYRKPGSLKPEEKDHSDPRIW